MSVGINWTFDKIAELMKLKARGLSNAVIGAKMNLSRNAVIGKSNRLGLKGPRMAAVVKKRSYSSNPKAKTYLPNFNISTPKQRVAPTLVAIEEPQGKLWRGELPKQGCCKWPHGGPGDWQWCSQPKMAGKTYCEFHDQQAHKRVAA